MIEKIIFMRNIIMIDIILFKILCWTKNSSSNKYYNMYIFIAIKCNNLYNKLGVGVGVETVAVVVVDVRVVVIVVGGGTGVVLII